MYAYVNNLGCDGGGRLCCYGRSFVVQNGKLLTMTTQTQETLLDEIEVSVVHIDSNTIQQYRRQMNIRTRSYDAVKNYLHFSDEDLFVQYENIESLLTDINVINIEGFDIYKLVFC